MMRYFIYLAYNGEQYCGWQTQPNGNTVQETLEKGLSTMLRIPISIVGAGRTDAGVHARNMVAHFDFDGEFCASELVYRFNRFLPLDIVIHKIVKVKEDAHARFDALSRTYKYYITVAKDPFVHKLKHKVHSELDIEQMNKCAKVFFDYQDFTSFSKLHTDVTTNNCNIMAVEWENIGNDYIFTIKANRFLRNMVRSIVGTLLDVGRGKIDEKGIRDIIEANDRSRAGSSAPGNALFLEEIEYDKKIFEI